ncbi:MAG TPA: EAL domain-containing protein, partial [Abditibacteriaceae bacterium]
VSGLGANSEDTAIVRAVITLARTLGMKITAEGIETAQQRSQLESLDCDFGQGFYFARPVEAASISAMLQQNERVMRAKFD